LESREDCVGLEVDGADEGGRKEEGEGWSCEQGWQEAAVGEWRWMI
jgi:hypothetical protein